MSHFIVMVTNVNEVPVEEQLAPFCEEVDEDDYFAKKEYYLKNDEKQVNDWLDNELKKNEESLNEEDPMWRKYAEENIKKIKDIQAKKTVDEKLVEIQEFNGGGLDEGGLYWISNPNAKWDWWVEGGRWNDWLVKKNGERCNRCLVKEVDFEGIRKAEMEDRAKWYDEEIKRAEEDKRQPFFYDFKETPTKEEYVNGKVWVSPYAVLHDGEWIEKGEMGWWGIDDPHYTYEDWEKKFLEFFKTLDPETEIAIVDCHI